MNLKIINGYKKLSKEQQQLFNQFIDNYEKRESRFIRLVSVRCVIKTDYIYEDDTEDFKTPVLTTYDLIDKNGNLKPWKQQLISNLNEEKLIQYTKNMILNLNCYQNKNKVCVNIVNSQEWY